MAMARALIELTWIVAMTGFVAAGCGLAGARPLHRFWRVSTALAVAASIIAFSTLRRVDLMPGLLFDALALVAVYRWPEEAPFSRASNRWKRIFSATGSVSAFALTVYVATCASTRAWHSQWGVSDDELDLAFPGDLPDRDPTFEVNHGVTINAPPSSVWPWLLQMGQDRAGFYSYDSLENLFGLEIRNADRIHDEWQNRAVGDLVRATPTDWMGGLLGGLGWKITRLDPEHALVLEGWGAFVLRSLPDGRTRLLVRSTVSNPNIPVWAAAVTLTTFELPHFIMERQMLRGITARAEKHIAPAPTVAPGTAIAGH
jgi:hypothetical protein